MDIKKEIMIKQIKCQFCTKEILNTEETLLNHLSTDHKDIVNVTKLNCEKCLTSFTKPSELLDHLLFSLFDEKTCTLCQKYYNTNSVPLDHYREQHENYVLKHWWKCEYCEVYFMPKHQKYHRCWKSVQNMVTIKPVNNVRFFSNFELSALFEQVNS